MSRLLPALSSLVRRTTIPSAGVDVPIHLLDDTAVKLKITPGTTVGAVCIAMRHAMSLRYDAHFGLFEYSDGFFRLLEDASPLSKVLAKWSQDVSAPGPKRLVFKRYIFLAGSPTDADALAATTEEDAAHRLAFIDAEYHFLHGHYRGDTAWVVQQAAWLMQSYRGDWDAVRDTLPAIRSCILSAVPLYSVKGGDVPREDARAHGVGAAAYAGSLDDMAARVFAAYRGLQGRSRLQAQKMFIKTCKECETFGYDMYPAKRTWKEVDPSVPGRKMVEVARTEDVIVAVGGTAIMLLGCGDPHHITRYGLEDVNKWTLSRDGRIFAFSMEDERIVYLVSEAAMYIERSLERFIAERVRMLSGHDAHPASHVARTEASVGSPIPMFSEACAPPPPRYAVSRIFPVPSAPAAGAAAASSSESPSADRASLPPGWKALSDADGDVYYWNETTNETTWDLPSWPEPAADSAERPRADSSDSIASGWQAVQDDDGDFYYYNASTGESTWTKPQKPRPTPGAPAPDAQLPDGWAVYYDDSGDPYYYNATTGVTSWHKPNPDGSFSQ